MNGRKESELNISKPGIGKRIISPSKAVEIDPYFFKKRAEEANWILKVERPDGTVEKIAPGTNWEVVSKFGSIRSTVITNAEGMPDYDRPIVREAPNVNIVVYGKDKKTREIKIAMISQARPHADNVFEPESDEAMIFEQIPMGFLDKLFGNDLLNEFESTQVGAIREVGEETGATVIKNISYPKFPEHYPNPTFIATTSRLIFVEIDLDIINKQKIDKKEAIFAVDFMSLNKLLKHIQEGKTENGYARMATSNSAILIFLSGLKTFQNAGRRANVEIPVEARIRSIKRKSSLK